MNHSTTELDALATLIAPFDASSAKYLRSLRNRSAQQIADDLNLWGGSGSLMDEALVNQPREVCRKFEAAVVRLGRTLIEQGAHSPRMEKWIVVFERWAREGV